MDVVNLQKVTKQVNDTARTRTRSVSFRSWPIFSKFNCSLCTSFKNLSSSF